MVELLQSAWIPVSVLAGVSGYFRSIAGSWLSPGAFVGIYWVLNISASLLAVDHRVPALGIWTLVSLVFAVQIGAILAGTTKMGRAQEGSQIETAPNASTRARLRKACVLLTATAMLGEAYFISSSLDLFQQALSWESLIQMGAKWTLLRYSGFTDPWPLRVEAVWVYPVALLGGLFFPFAACLRDKVIGAFSLLPSLVLTLLSGGRAAFLVALACWLGGFGAIRVVLGTPKLNISRWKLVALVAAGSAGLLLLFVVISSLRGATYVPESDTLDLDFNGPQIRNYMFGPPAAFADWLNRGDESPLSWGALTFPGPFDLLHIHAKTFGTYTDSAQTVGLEGTNIYTIFRGLIQDFGLVGSFLLAAVVGFISSSAYNAQSLRAGRLLFLAAFYAGALFSPLYCLFSFNGPIFSWALVWLVYHWASQTAPSS